MELDFTAPFELRVTIERWPLATPFRITGKIFESMDVIAVNIEKGGRIGVGEACGLYYMNDTPSLMAERIESIRTRLEAGFNRTSLQDLLPPGGARNALDCAVWDLEAELTGRAAWQIASIRPPEPLLTTLTCGADEPRRMANRARREYAHGRAIKLKLTGEPVDAERVRAVREARADVWLAVDANQGFTRTSFEEILPTLVDARVALIEQPFPIGQDALLDGLQCPIPIAADESLQHLSDLPRIAGRFSVANIKLDKCGGVTEALAMARAAREFGLTPMVGNMGGTSLSMAPAFLVGQLCDIVDLDAPMFLKSDRAVTVQYRGGYVTSPNRLWGGESASEA